MPMLMAKPLISTLPTVSPPLFQMPLSLELLLIAENNKSARSAQLSQRELLR